MLRSSPRNAFAYAFSPPPPPFHCHAAVTYYPIDNSISLFIFGRNRASADTWDIHVFAGNLGKMYIYIGEFWFVSHFFTTRITHGRFTFLYKKCYWNSINQMVLKKKGKMVLNGFFFMVCIFLSFFFFFLSRITILWLSILILNGV